jgi:hypothetical protein
MIGDEEQLNTPVPRHQQEHFEMAGKTEPLTHKEEEPTPSWLISKKDIDSVESLPTGVQNVLRETNRYASDVSKGGRDLKYEDWFALGANLDKAVDDREAENDPQFDQRDVARFQERLYGRIRDSANKALQDKEVSSERKREIRAQIPKIEEKLERYKTMRLEREQGKSTVPAETQVHGGVGGGGAGVPPPPGLVPPPPDVVPPPEDWRLRPPPPDTEAEWRRQMLLEQRGARLAAERQAAVAQEQVELMRSPEEEREAFREYERTGKPPLTPFSAKIFERLEPREDHWMRTRFKLANALSHKVNTFSLDKMYPENPINELIKDDLKFLFGEELVDKKSGKAINEETAAKMDKRDVERVPTVPGYMEAVSFYTYAIIENANLDDFFSHIDGKKELPSSIFEFKDREHLDNLTYNFALWLVQNRGLEAQYAQDVAHSAWALVSAANLVEVYDNRFNPKLRASKWRVNKVVKNFFPVGWKKEPLSKRIPAGMDARLMSLPVRTAACPQERWESKVNAGDPSVNVFGPWGVNLTERRAGILPWKWKLFTRDPRRVDLLPRQLLPDAFSEIKEEKDRRHKERSFKDLFYDNGRRLTKDPNARLEQIDFDRVREGPVGGYIFTTVKNAKTVMSAIEGRRFGTWKALGEACEALEVGRRYRNNIRKGIFGIRADSFNLRVDQNKRGEWKGFSGEAKRRSSGRMNRRALGSITDKISSVWHEFIWP